MSKGKSTGQRQPEIELHPDAWDRFTEFVKRIARAGPQHRQKKPESATKKPKRNR